jgi:PhoPQ-activated pathogenicity-related protein
VVPAVIDVLNLRATTAHHYSAYGFWAPAIGDYSRHRLQEQIDNPRYAEILKIVDPYSYLDRLTLPKYVVNSAGDQFFPPDSSKFYFDDLKGVKYLRYVPNTDHSLGGSDAIFAIQAFYHALLTGRPLPRFTWRVERDGTIVVKAEDRPKEVNVWSATNPKERDFRLASIGRAYRKATLAPSETGEYVARVEKPAKGWTAFFAELVYESGTATPLKFTTQVHVLPDVYPFSFDEYRRKLKVGSPATPGD